MAYGAITIDTQTVEHNGFDLDGKLLALLKQFRGGPIQVLISEIIASEILGHLREHTKATRQEVENNHRKAILYGLHGKDTKPFATAIDADTLAKRRLERYFEEIGAQIVKASAVLVNDVFDLFFASAPPFKPGKKKAEFPDAFALLSLQRWAKENNKRILAVSGDDDWKRFAQTCDEIDVVALLDDALALLQIDRDADAIISRILPEMYNAKRPDLTGKLETLLSVEIGNFALYGEADSAAYSVDGEQCELTLTSFNLADEGEDYRIVEAHAARIVVQVDLQVVVDATGYFSLSFWDSTDRETVAMGSTSAKMEDVELEITVLITFEGDFAKGEIEITKVETLGDGGTLDFGTIEPDYGSDRYDEAPDDEDENEDVEAGLEPEDDLG